MDSTYMSLVTSLPVVALEVIITPIKVKSNRYWVLIWVTKKEAIWIALAGLFVHVDIKYWDFFNLGGHFYYSNFLHSSNGSALRFFDFALFHGFFQLLSLFVPGTWNLAKIWGFNFLQFSWPHIHETLTLDFFLIFMTPGTWNLAKIRSFNFL